jgi:hypothetical protein
MGELELLTVQSRIDSPIAGRIERSDPKPTPVGVHFDVLRNPFLNQPNLEIASFSSTRRRYAGSLL